MKLNTFEVGLVAAGVAGLVYFIYSRDAANLKQATASASAFEGAYNALSANFTKLYNNSPNAASILNQ